MLPLKFQVLFFYPFFSFFSSFTVKNFLWLIDLLDVTRKARLEEKRAIFLHEMRLKVCGKVGVSVGGDFCVISSRLRANTTCSGRKHVGS